MAMATLPVLSIVRHPAFQFSTQRSTTITALTETFLLVTGQRVDCGDMDEILELAKALSRRFSMARFKGSERDKKDFIKAQRKWLSDQYLEVRSNILRGVSFYS